MNARSDTERILDAYLAPEADRLPDRVLDAALASVARTPQRRALRVPWRIPTMLSLKPSSTLAAVAVLVAGGVVAAALLARPNIGGPQPTPTSTPSVLPTTAASVDPTLAPIAGLPGTLVFRTEAGGTFDIARMQPDRTGFIRLTTGPNSDTGPSVSADGTRIAFQRTSPGQGTVDIWVVNPDGSGAMPITATDVYEDWPSLSPDGTRVAFSRAYNDEDGQAVVEIAIRAVSAAAAQRPLEDDTVVFRHVDDPGTFIDLKPTWSPDGSRIAYVSNVDGGYRLYSVNVDGTDNRKLSDDPAAGRPAWSPDAGTIAFTDTLNGGCLWLVDATGGPRQPVSDMHCSDGPVAWSPDGVMIAWAGGTSLTPIYVVHRDGNALRQLTDDRAYGDLAWASMAP